MKFCYFAAFALASGSHAFSPQLFSSTLTRPSATELHAQPSRQEGWMGPAAAVVAGWTLAAQVAFAAPLPLTSLDLPALVMESSSSVVVSGSFDTVDFSMPSYSEATKGEVKTSSSGGAPSFNPFGDFDFGLNKASDDAAPAEAAPAVVDTSKADAKAAADAKKAEEKAAAEAKKAEKEARRKAELEKQKEAVERANQRKEDDAAAASSEEAPALSMPEISIPSFSAPEVPDIKLPDFKAPDIKMPEFKAPDFKLPEFKAPEFKMPEFKAPEFTTPDVDMPAFKAPDVKVPEFQAPDLKMPEFKAPDIKMPEFKAPEMPKFAMPSMPKLDLPAAPSAPKIPSFDAPKSNYEFESYSSSSPSSVAGEEDIEPQEVRDARAKEARSVFLGADNEAKEIERQARELRNIANEKKKIAKELKDEACVTRFGGKFLCLRPLNSGY